MTISKSGQEWTLPSQLGRLNIGQDGKGLLETHLWCPDDLPRLWDRIENRIFYGRMGITGRINSWRGSAVLAAGAEWRLFAVFQSLSSMYLFLFVPFTG